MTAVSAPRPGWELLAGQVNQRRYEALRAYLYDRAPAPEASTSPATSGRATRLPAAAVTDFAALPARAHTTMAGLLLAIPDLVALDLPALAAAAGYPGSTAIPATGYLLALLALKLTAT